MLVEERGGVRRRGGDRWLQQVRFRFQLSILLFI